MKKGAEYKIGEVAALLGINTSVLRFWEKEFPWIVPKRTEKKHRVYTDESIQRVRVIQTLLYDKGMTIEGAKKLLANKDKLEQFVSGQSSSKTEHTEITALQGQRVDSIIQELEELRVILNPENKP